MYQIETDTQRESGPKTKKTIAAIHNDEKDNSDKDKESAAFQKQKFSKSTDQKKTSSPTKGSYKGPSSSSSSGPGNNSNQNGKYCFYCKLQNHTQEDCFKRNKRDKKPCKDKQDVLIGPECM
jgi:hypothetical protein